MTDYSTRPACPPWCTTRHGGQATTGPYRVHQPDEVRLHLEPIPRRFHLDGSDQVTVNASCVQFADGRALSLVEVAARAAMTPADARRLAAALLWAAHLLDTTTRGDSR